MATPLPTPITQVERRVSRTIITSLLDETDPAPGKRFKISLLVVDEMQTAAGVKAGERSPEKMKRLPMIAALAANYTHGTTTLTGRKILELFNVMLDAYKED